MTDFTVYPPGFGPTVPQMSPGNGRVPGEWPKNQSVDFWSHHTTLSSWGPAPRGLPPDITGVRFARWSTPVFDLLPHLKAAPSQGSFSVQPIWRSGLGAGGHLFVKIDGLESTPTATADLRVLYEELVDPIEPSNLSPITSNGIDITTEFSGRRTATLLDFWPAGEGYPIRYWRISIVFVMMVLHPDPTFAITAAYY